MEQFTRHETVVLTRTSPARLAYLARIGLVIPQCSGDPPVQQAYYSWEQVLELRAIRRLRRQVSLQTIRKILAFLEGVGSDRTLHNKYWVIADGEVNWVQTYQEDALQVVQVAGKTNRHVGQLKLMPLPLLPTQAEERWVAARHAKVIDFEPFRRRAFQSKPD